MSESEMGVHPVASVDFLMEQSRQQEATIATLTTQLASAEKVCEAIKIIEHMHAPIDVDVDFCQRCTTAWPCATYKKAHAALTEWRRTKEQGTVK